jgi:hypothetical protein
MANTQPVPNLIQGISQQAPALRRDSQCEAQYNCLNSAKDGAVSRNGGDLIKFRGGEDWSGAFVHEITRGTTEHYLLVIKEGMPRVINLHTGEDCSLTIEGSAGAYLSGSDYCAQTVDDTTFIANRAIIPAMGTTVSPSRPHEALVFFKAGDYSMTFTMNIVYAGTTYTYTYTTPDNSASGNYAYIHTNQLAATFFRALTGATTAIGSGGDVVGAATTTTSDGTLPAGFGVQLKGNLLRIFRTDAKDFTIAVSDGAGDANIKAFKGSVSKFSDLPKGGFPGMLFAVSGTDKDAADDYYVAYVADTAGATGVYQEATGPGVHTSLDASTMPHALVNTGVNAFTFRAFSWSARICGDEDTAPDPYFVGRRIESLFFARSRLGILTEPAFDMSKAKRYTQTYFPDTKQTLLDTAPISYMVAAGEEAALLRKVVKINEGLYLWAQRAQFRISSGNDPLTESTIDVKESTAYEFAEDATPLPMGASLYFATEPGDYANILQLFFENGLPVGDVNVTAHVEELIPAGVRKLVGSMTRRILFVQSSGAPSSLYVYNWLQQGSETVQSAWNIWTLPAGSILWCSVYKKDLQVLLQRPSGVALLSFPLSTTHVDEGGVYATQVDLRITEAGCTIVWDPDTQLTTITTPIPYLSDEAGLVQMVVRTSGSRFNRGRRMEVVSVSGSTVAVRGNLTDHEFYLGLTRDARRTESQFHIRGESGEYPTDTLTVQAVKLGYHRTLYTRIESTNRSGKAAITSVSAIEGRQVGTAQSELGPPVLRNGTLRHTVNRRADEVTLELINDSPFPSAWRSLAWEYEATLDVPLTPTRRS